MSETEGKYSVELFKEGGEGQRQPDGCAGDLSAQQMRSKHVHVLRSMRANHWATANEGQMEARCQATIDAAFSRAGIDKRR